MNLNKTETIKDFYNKSSFSDIHGSEIFNVILISIIFFILLSYFYVMSEMKAIKNDWIKRRCDPRVMPFAGFINGKGSFKEKVAYTITNFEGCTSSILQNISGFYLKPVQFIVTMLSGVINELKDVTNMMRKYFKKMRGELSKITEKIMTSIQVLLLPIIELVLKAKVVIDKTIGALMTSLYAVISMYLNIKSTLTYTMNQTIELLWVSFFIIVALLWIPFGAVIAIPALAIFTFVLGLVIVLKIFLSRVFEISGGKVPGIPSCFDKDTKILLKNGKLKSICEINVGDVLIDGGIVTATFISTTRNQELYNLNNILVTGEHKIYHKNLGLIKVKNHSDSILVEDYRKELVYCINTTTKNIPINNYIFTDWDELDNFDLYYLEQNSNIHNKLSRDFNLSDIHSNLDSGFTDDTTVELEDGRTIQLKEVEVNDILKFGERVHSTVKIDTEGINTIKEYYLGQNNYLKCTNNVLIKNYDYLDNINTEELSGNSCKRSRYLYHLVTDTGYYNINNVTVYDYNSALEQYLK